MKIFYVTTCMSENAYNLFYNTHNIKTGQQIQKFHSLFLSGLRNLYSDITALSAIPLNRDIDKKLIFSIKDELENGVLFKYLNVVNIPIIKQLFYFINCSLKLLRYSEKDSLVLFDILNISLSFSIILVKRFKRFKVTAIVTDIPTYLFDMENNTTLKNKIINNVINYIFMKIVNSSDGFVFLTEHMNMKLNIKNKPYQIIEGFSDLQMINVTNNIENKFSHKVCMYTGLINIKYGLDKLVHSFQDPQLSDFELHIYGNGDFEKELINITKSFSNIKYFGTIKNKELILLQTKASLLINPRPTCFEFTKYSFPSKTIEYMASGTPVLTTRLEGIPIEYLDYLYILNDESLEGFIKTIKEILSKSKEELSFKGQKSKDFILKYKNNIIQIQKVGVLIDRLTNEK